MNRSFYLQILVLAVFISWMGSINTYAQDHSTGPIPESYVKYNKTPDMQILGDNPLATLAYGYGNQLLQTLSMPLPAGQPFTNLGAFTFPSFASSMTKGGDGNYYLTTTYQTTPTVQTAKLYTVSTAGVVTLLGDITGTGTNSVNGISYNPNNSTYYLMGATTPTNSLLYSFDVNTRVATLIGTVGTGALMIDLCFDFSGNCYTYDLVTDNAYIVDETTGAATLLGPLGFSANFGQGMGYDFETGWIYLSAFRNLPSNDGQLRVMDPQTGYTNFLASYGVNQVAPFAPASTIAALPGPGRATNPTIVNGAINVPISTPSVGWTNAGGATSVEVFFGTNPQSLPSIYSGAVVSSRPVTLNYSTTYYWYVNETSGAGTTKGTLWSFTTAAAPCLALPLPVLENFELGVFPPLCWQNTGTTTIWMGSNAASGYGIGTYSAKADFYNVGSGTGDLLTLEYNSTGAGNPTLTFDWAYATYIDDPDEMDIYYSTNAGTTWTLLLAMPGGLNGILNPFQLATTSAYVPLANQWSTKSLTLPAGTNKVRFAGVTAFGNNLYLDNVKIYDRFLDGFEPPTYTVPGQVACQNPTVWTTWTASPCGADDATISTAFAFTGTQSALIDYVTGRDVDLIKPLGNKTTGKWYIGFFAYIPAGKTGYFNTLAAAPLPDPPGPDWGMEVYFNAAGAGQLTNVPGGPINFTWYEGQWHQVLVVVDFEQTPTLAEFWVGKVGQMSQLYTWDWTQGATVTDQLGANDFFGAVLNSDQMYIDDYYFSNVPPPIQRLANDVGTVSIDMNYQYGPGTITPLATVKNYGTATNTFNVQMTISGGYSSTKTVPPLADGATYQVTFDSWTVSTIGPYTIDVTTQLATDDNPDNNSQTKGVHIWDDSGEWTTGAVYPITAYNGAGVSYSDGTTDWLFVMGGNTPSTLGTECYKYNLTTNTWTQIASLPAKRIIAAGAAVGNFIYLMGGSDGTLYTNTTYKYDIVGDSWSTVAPLPSTVGWGRATAYNNYIYLAGGISAATGGSYLNTVYLYDATLNVWTTATPMPLAVFGGGFGITGNGNTLVYAAGAYETGISNTVMVGTIVSPATINWTVMDNTYPGIGKEVTDQYGASLVAEMFSQEIGLANNHSPDAAVYPAGAIYRTHAHSWGSDAIIMGGGTPTSNYPQAGPSPCYIYKPATDTWIAQENVPVTIGAHQSGTFSNGSTWKYVIASGFGTTVAVSNTQIYTQSLQALTFQLSVAIATGWNMVSIPGLHPVDQNVGTWWAFKDPAANVFRYSGGYQAVTAAIPGIGYWMKHSGARTYNTGDEWPAGGINIVPHTPLNGAAGWNLIGGYEIVATAALVTTNPPGQQSGPIFKYSGGYSVATQLVPGYGYWIKLSSAAQIIIPETLAKDAQPVEWFPENWGKIVLTDATGINYTLYAVKGETDLSQYELPPAPMAGMFDIRYSSGRIAEDLNSAIKTIEMSGVTYPLTVRVEGMDIRLMDETGKNVNVNLKSGEDVVISDATIQKLMVSGELIPAEYALEQNYPNPFNPSTVIEFSLPENVGNVKLSIYNALGEKVAELVNTALTAGKYQYQWNAQNVATGMYIYELRTDKFVSVRKMMLMK